MNLQEIFLQVLKISLSASVAAGLVMLLRFCFRKAPRGLVCALWLLVAVRLLIWQLPESKVSVIPETVSSGSSVTRPACTRIAHWTECSSARSGYVVCRPTGLWMALSIRKHLSAIRAERKICFPRKAGSPRSFAHAVSSGSVMPVSSERCW